MKRYRRVKVPLLIGLVGCLCFWLASCKYSNTPESVAQRFLISFNRLDFTAAKSLSTHNTWEFLDIMDKATQQVSEERKESYADHFSVKIFKVEQESDSTVVVTFKTEPKRLPFNQLRLFKTYNKNGDIRWKVDISTLDLLNSEDYDAEPMPEDLKEPDSVGIKD